MGARGRGPGSEHDSEVVAAAAAFERALRRFEALAKAAGRDPLSSRKNIEKAAEALREAEENREGTVVPLQELAASVGRARDRFEAASALLVTRAGELQARIGELRELFGRFEAIQGRLASLNQELLGSGGPPASPDAARQLAGRLGAIGERMDELAEETRALARDAEAARIGDLARDAESLRQRILAVRNKMKRIRAPS